MSAVPTLGRATAVEPLARPAEALGQRLYELHSPLVLRYCLQRLRNREDAEDAAQTTFFYALRALRRGVVPEVETAWLMTIARNVCHERGRSARRRGDIEATHDPHVLQEVAPAVDNTNGDAEALKRALTQLPAQQRQAIVLREWHGLAYREIAARLQLTQGAVEALIFRARRSLAVALEREGQTRARVLNLGSVLAGLKSLFGGASAVKLAGVFAGTIAALAVSTGVARDLAADRSAPASPRNAASADRAPRVPISTEVVAARSTRLTTASVAPRREAGGRDRAKVGVTTSDPKQLGQDDPAPTSAVTDAPGQTVDDAVSVVSDTVAATLPALSGLPQAEVLPAETPVAGLPAVPLP